MGNFRTDTDSIVAMITTVKEKEDHLDVLRRFAKDGGALRLQIQTEGPEDNPVNNAIGEVANRYLPSQLIMDTLIRCAEADLNAVKAEMYGTIEAGKQYNNATKLVAGLPEMAVAE